jgi:hypothetical protein
MLRGFFVVALALCALGVAPCGGQDTFQQEADRLATLLNCHAVNVVAEIGASNGKLTVAAAHRVGSSGKVYSTELDAKPWLTWKNWRRRRGISLSSRPPKPTRTFLPGAVTPFL